jgi:hypothetical protein
MNLETIILIDQLGDDAIIDGEDLATYFGISDTHVRWLNSQDKSALPTRCKLFKRLLRYRMGDVREFVRTRNDLQAPLITPIKSTRLLGRPTKKQQVEQSRNAVLSRSGETS